MWLGSATCQLLLISALDTEEVAGCRAFMSEYHRKDLIELYRLILVFR